MRQEHSHTLCVFAAAKGKKSSKTEQKGTVGKGAGKKITKIISLGKKKPSTDEQTSSAEEDVPTSGKTTDHDDDDGDLK